MPDNLGPQFDDDRVAAAMAIPQHERRLRLYSDRKEAAKRNATHWALQVDHSSHDDLQQGVTVRQQTHVVLSREEFPGPAEAEQVAYLIGHARGTYPTRVKHI